MTNQKSNLHILIIDDDKHWRQCLSELLSDEGYLVATAEDGVDALEQIKKSTFHLAIVDLKMPKMDGVEVLRKIKKYDSSMEVIILTGFGTVESAVEAMKIGAFDYLTKPCNLEETKLTVKNALHHKAIIEENIALHRKLEVTEELGPLIGKSKKMQEVYNRINNAANIDLTVLIHGESGVGKELVASAIHYKSVRAKKSFLQVNCATFTETLLESELFGHVKGSFTGAFRDKSGLFESANHGTLFLDEIATLSPSVQAQLLRVIEYKEFMKLGDSKTTKVDVRLIVSTNENLKKCVEKGSFREDLFYRINVYPIFIPPLREREDDIPLFVSYFLHKYNDAMGKAFKEVSREALNLLLSYNWPGNVRELENVIAGSVAEGNGSVITLDDISSYISVQKPLKSSFREAKKEVLEDFEKRYLIEVLRGTGGNITRAAQKSGIDRKNFSEKLKYYNIDRKSL